MKIKRCKIRDVNSAKRILVRSGINLEYAYAKLNTHQRPSSIDYDFRKFYPNDWDSIAVLDRDWTIEEEDLMNGNNNHNLLFKAVVELTNEEEQSRGSWLHELGKKESDWKHWWDRRNLRR